LIDFECGPERRADDFLEVVLQRPTAASWNHSCSSSKARYPNEKIKDEGYWCGFGNEPGYGQPMTT
jgi:hydrogenase small subunit